MFFFSHSVFCAFFIPKMLFTLCLGVINFSKHVAFALSGIGNWPNIPDIQYGMDIGSLLFCLRSYISNDRVCKLAIIC